MQAACDPTMGCAVCFKAGRCGLLRISGWSASSVRAHPTLVAKRATVAWPTLEQHGPVLQNLSRPTGRSRESSERRRPANCRADMLMLSGPCRYFKAISICTRPARSSISRASYVCRSGGIRTHDPQCPRFIKSQFFQRWFPYSPAFKGNEWKPSAVKAQRAQRLP